MSRRSPSRIGVVVGMSTSSTHSSTCSMCRDAELLPNEKRCGRPPAPPPAAHVGSTASISSSARSVARSHPSQLLRAEQVADDDEAVAMEQLGGALDLAWDRAPRGL